MWILVPELVGAAREPPLRLLDVGPVRGTPRACRTVIPRAPCRRKTEGKRAHPPSLSS
ncbi:hypothetical protein SBA2_520004 [Acidobacteriia bacterium SbA2]|nr:hypothetical protein SBA2_520004 [Acidobacteriia bacterium SbA2]